MHYMLRLSSDITTKAPRTRRRFTRNVVDNLRDAFASNGITADVQMGWSRIYVEAADPRTPDVTRRVFGVHSLSPVAQHEFTSYEDLLRIGSDYFRPRMRGLAFAVRARCSASTTALHGSQIERDLGALLVPYGRVRLSDPEVTCWVELRDGSFFLFTDSLHAERGLPIGSQGRALVLFSGGFDSAVAAWMMLRRGVALDYVLCRLGGPVHTLGAVRVLQVLTRDWSYGSRPRLFVVPFEEVADAIRARCRPSAVQLVLKRFMYRAAAELTRRARASAIVTGESLGQVSSQTLKNLVALDDGRIPMLRPLIGIDKEETLQRSREIGTFDLSSVVHEYCALSSGKPAVAATRRHVREEEAKVPFDLTPLLDVPPFDARQLREVDFAIEGLEISAIPEGAVVLDLRSKTSFEHWHYPEALRLDLDLALAHVTEFDPAHTYVACCELGLKSVHLAMVMRKAGLQAFSFTGGTAALLRHAVERDLAPPELLSST